jgi:hypothetical protein
VAKSTVLRPEDETALKTALAELYCACHGNISIGDLWVQLLSSRTNSTPKSNVKWRKVFHRIDHRRFASFGLVHGLIRRIHCYPMAENDTLEDDERDIRVISDLGPAASWSGLACLPANRTTSAGSHARQHPHQQPSSQERAMALRVSHLMDGRRCDDEIVSTIGRPIEELLEMVRDRTVTCVYAPGRHY